VLNRALTNVRPAETERMRIEKKKEDEDERGGGEEKKR
jgi:hypothetical protein